MRPQKVEDQPLLDGLMAVLRAKGYDGSSLNELASASGLQKASLYHRFPGGKKELTLAVLLYVKEGITKYIYELLTDQSIPPPERLRGVIRNIHSLYNNGKESCILKALSMDSGVELFGEQIKESMQLWIKAFTALGKGIQSTAPFVSAIESIEKLYGET
jgi:AcrR family transcriptional regulator